MSAFVNFEVDRLKKKKKKKKKMMKNIQKRRCGSFRMSLYTCILHTLRVLYDRETLVEPCYMSERLITVAFRSYELFHLVNGRVRVGAIPT